MAPRRRDYDPNNPKTWERGELQSWAAKAGLPATSDPSRGILGYKGRRDPKTGLSLRPAGREQLVRAVLEAPYREYWLANGAPPGGRTAEGAEGTGTATE